MVKRQILTLETIGSNPITVVYVPIAQMDSAQSCTKVCLLSLVLQVRVLLGTLHCSQEEDENSNETQLPDIPHLFAARGNAFNAGCMINGYAPVTLRELRENNQRFLEILG